MSGLPESLRATLDRLAAKRRHRPVAAVLAQDPAVVAFPKASCREPEKPPEFQPSAITGHLPWWAKD